MSTLGPHNRGVQQEKKPLSAASDEWERQFVKHLQIAYAEFASELPPEATFGDFRRAMLRAFVATLRDSGAGQDEVIQLLATGVGLISPPAESEGWTSEKSDRRLELVDKRIQQKLSADEAIELARLTELMRVHCDSEATVPLEGARRLHRQLLGIDGPEKASD
jgi:hypothetical protein